MERSRWIRLAAFAAPALALALAAKAAPPLDLKRDVPLSQAVYDRRGTLLRLKLAADEKYRLWRPLADFSPALVEATLLQEDRYFRSHPGVNPFSLIRAAWRTYVLKGRRVGGSTVTMQTARLRWRIDSSSPAGKLLQIARAFELELRCTKDEILEAYLNLAPYGGNIEGAAAASLVYFGKDVSKLTGPEAATLAVIPQNPVRRGRSESAALEEARRRLFERWLKRHPEDAAQRLAFAGGAPEARELPFSAPHFSGRPSADGSIVRTTLDLPLQRLVELNLEDYIKRRRHRGLSNAAALLVDRRTMEVLASVGSAGFFNAAIEGQVDGTRAKRSPGSALKPFIYALALDQGLIHPLTLLKDTPGGWRGFNPENFDRDFMGPVKARDALILSRNVPAVHLASELKPSFHAFLKEAGIAGLRDEEHYGLSLVLGSAEVTMEELVRLYAALGNGGLLRPLRARLEEPPAPGKRLLSAEAAELVLDILKDAPRPGQAFHGAWTRDDLPVHWKTGTSYGHRDAWSVGLFGPYALAVWIGRFDGAGNPAFVGLDAAAPLFFQIVDAVKAREKDLAAPAPPPIELARVPVCSLSGRLPGPHCRRTLKTLFIPGRSPIASCDIHRELLVDRTGRRACRPGPGVRPQVHEVWPSDLLKVFQQAGIPRRSPPPDNPDCVLSQKDGHGLAPVIVTPQAGVSYNVRSAGAADPIAFSAVTDGDARELFWYVNERFVGKSPRGEPLFWAPSPGRWIVRAVDDRGRSDARPIVVSVVE